MPQCLPVTLFLCEAGPRRFRRQLSFTDIYHTIPYHAGAVASTKPHATHTPDSPTGMVRTPTLLSPGGISPADETMKVVACDRPSRKQPLIKQGLHSVCWIRDVFCRPQQRCWGQNTSQIQMMQQSES